jgi:hypothetical protein
LEGVPLDQTRHLVFSGRTCRFDNLPRDEMNVESERASLPLRVKLAMYCRLFAVQGSWNYETLLGTGIGFAIEPALRLLPGGRDGPEYRAALARQSRYFNAHPYLAGIAVGALARAELDGVDPARIERFRSALAGPSGRAGCRSARLSRCACTARAAPHWR